MYRNGIFVCTQHPKKFMAWHSWEIRGTTRTGPFFKRHDYMLQTLKRTMYSLFGHGNFRASISVRIIGPGDDIEMKRKA